MTYLQALKYLESFINYEKIPAWPYKESLKLERIKGFLKTIDNPQDSLRCIHIAGTKGKGSTSAFVAYILRQAGYKVGLYTSPHLADFRERIRILNSKSRFLNPKQIPIPKSKITKLANFEGMISRLALARLVERLKPKITRYNKGSKYGPLSFFEVYTTLAFVYFKEKKVDFVVLETGLGGRLDATNVVNPLVCAITPISYEHTQKLGNTLREIATEKAGIIKAPGSRLQASKLIVISAPQEKEALRVIYNKCRETKAKLYEVGKDILVAGRWSLVAGQRFDIKGIFRGYSNLEIKLIGGHQKINAAVAVGIIEALGFYNINIGSGSIRGGLYQTIWPGRCEVISKRPLVILDGAQNIASARVLKKAIREDFSMYKKLILVLGISKDKDIKGMCRELCVLADKIILTRAQNPRAASVDVIEKNIRIQGLGSRLQVMKTKDVREAKALALSLADKKDLILVTGSLFVVGEFRYGKS